VVPGGGTFLDLAAAPRGCGVAALDEGGIVDFTFGGYSLAGVAVQLVVGQGLADCQTDYCQN
jgi:hypothetical protein